MASKSLITRWGRWNCSNCLNKRISAKHKLCPTCEDPRNPELSPTEKPYSDPNGEIVSTSEDVTWAEAGPAWNCGHCGELNQGDHTNCSNCDRPLSHDDTIRSTAEYREGPDTASIDFDDEAHNTHGWTDEYEHAERALTDTPETGEHRTLPITLLPTEGPAVDPEDATQGIPSRPSAYLSELKERTRQIDRKKAAKAGGIGATVTAIATGGFLLLSTTSVEIEVTELAWERQVEIEEYQTEQETGWDRPADAYNVTSRQEIRSYEQVPDGYETETYQEQVQTGTNTRTEPQYCTRQTDNGNGTFGSETYQCGTTTYTDPVYGYKTRTRQVQKYRNEPVYDTQYSYTIDRWKTKLWETTTGTPETTPYWATPTLNEGNNLGDQRIGNGRKETYTITFVDLNPENPDTYTHTTNQPQWKTYTPGQQYTADLNKLGSISNIRPK